jgi:hypothetical protein
MAPSVINENVKNHAARLELNGVTDSIHPLQLETFLMEQYALDTNAGKQLS